MESMTDWAFSWPISAGVSVLACRVASGWREAMDGWGWVWRLELRGDGAGGRTLVVVYDIAQVIPAAVMRLAHAHGVVREVHIAVVACFW